VQITPTALPEVLMIQPRVFSDERGFFFESFNQSAFDDAVGRHVEFVQDNHSRSQRGVLRGLHYQLPPHAQGKLVRVVSGRVFDVAVDMRRSSATFGRWVGTELDADQHRQLWIPAGFAHGFLVLSDTAECLYKTTDYYAPQAEGALCWNDLQVSITWPDPGVPIRMSGKDSTAPSLAETRTFD
jgi:dTDP-4-dehydrorhamnose 3,5-epimerase